jgi:LuxR family glucitol operon transcriptional activator
VTLTDAEAEKLYRRTGGVPLAVVWSVAQMGYGYGVDSVLRRLGEPTGDIARFCFEGAMESIQSKPAHTLLIALSLLDGKANRDRLGKVTDLPELDRDEGLVRLERLSLVNKQGDRFFILPLVREYVLPTTTSMSEKALAQMLVRIAEEYAPAAGGAVNAAESYVSISSEIKEEIVQAIIYQLYEWADYGDDYGVYLCIKALEELGTESAARTLRGVAEGHLVMLSYATYPVMYAEQDAIFALARLGKFRYLLGLLESSRTSTTIQTTVTKAIAEYGKRKVATEIENLLLSKTLDEEVSEALTEAREQILSRQR